MFFFSIFFNSSKIPNTSSRKMFSFPDLITSITRVLVSRNFDSTCRTYCWEQFCGSTNRDFDTRRPVFVQDIQQDARVTSPFASEKGARNSQDCGINPLNRGWWTLTGRLRLASFVHTLPRSCVLYVCWRTRK